MTPAQIIDGILAVEGERYTNDPKDSGGPTKWGWTLAGLEDYYGRAVSVQEVMALTREAARDAYFAVHWFRPGYDKIALISTRIATELCDTRVNLPPSKPGEFLQRSLNALNLEGSKYANVEVDGNCGAATRAALAAFLAWRGAEGETMLLALLNCLQGAYYLERAEKRGDNERFLYGWIKNRVAA